MGLRLEAAGLALTSALLSASALADGVDRGYRANVGCCAFTWTGFYVGVNMGTVATHEMVGNSGTDTGAAGIGTILANQGIARRMDLGDSGFIGGAQAGYNWQLGTFVVGVETDIQGVLGRQRFSTSTINAEHSIDWLGTTRLRAGVLASRSWLIYATGGIAYGDANLDVGVRTPAAAPAFAATASSSTHFGWTAGGGTEVAVSRNTTLKLEYLYFDLEDNKTILSQSYGAFASTLTSRGDETGHIVRFGANLKF